MQIPLKKMNEVILKLTWHMLSKCFRKVGHIMIFINRLEMQLVVLETLIHQKQE